MLLYWVNIEQHKYGMTFFLFIFIWISYVDIPDRPIMADQRWGWAFTSSMTKVVGVDVWKVWRYQGLSEDRRRTYNTMATRYQGIRRPKKDIQYNGHKIPGVIRRPKKDIQYNGHKIPKGLSEDVNRTKKDIQYNGQVKKGKQPSTKHCTKN